MLNYLWKSSCLSICVTLLLVVLSGCSGPSNSITISPVTSGPAPTVALSVTPAAVQPGQSATLTWSITNADACTASGAWSGDEPGSGSMNVMLQGTAAQSYTLQCSGAGGAKSQTVTLALASSMGACGAGQAVARHLPTSRAIAAARKAVATGTAGPRRGGGK